MPKNRTQRIVFGIIMSYAMAYGMEVYNVAIREGVNLTPGGSGTLIKNFPIAFFWNMFAAAPFSHWLFGKIFPDRG